ncbi:uncharacterized protein LOC107636523 [Arachis ipaensis]|uniref:uncharacterized protein LOC107636523 n=1 Tax=Arachis ipaensis TaxID=130454 RepID=UPI0007AF48E4|nr:uncharacterized protein LOC107636523 [Arachis ipaensis]XP_025647626.1 uncharacterized protein LOC112742601 [Arachis hypogaea]
MCMKPEYFMLSLLIPGPQSPGKDIDVYLQPLIEDLKLLWEIGVETYDASKNETFQMRAALLWTINDFPAYAMLSGWSTKGKLACPCCNKNTSYLQLKHSRKTFYMDQHVFLPMDHPWRTNTRSFNGEHELRPPPPVIEGTKIFEMLQNVENTFGKKQTTSNSFPWNWKKRSIFFEFPYWHNNPLRHNLDVMHIEKNILDSVIGTLLDIPANEVRLGGPVQFRWMYPPERYMCTLKSYVHNKSRPEGSIEEAYLAEECLTFCSRYLHEGVRTRLNKQPRNDDDLNDDEVVPSKLFSNKGRSLGVGNGEPINLDDISSAQAHVYVLHNCEEVTDYVREHEDDVNNQRRTKWRKAKVHNKTFSQWFETRARDPDVPVWLKELSRGPSSVARKFSGYIINGYRFHTVEREARRKTQNSGVTLTALTSSFASAKVKRPIQDTVAYYGRLFEINEPFILASQAHQCFYVQDPYEHNKYYVMETVPRDLFKTSDESESEARQTFYNEQNEHITSPAIPADDGELILERIDLRPTVIETVLQVTSAQEYEADFIGDFDSDGSA